VAIRFIFAADHDDASPDLSSPPEKIIRAVRSARFRCAVPDDALRGPRGMDDAFDRFPHNAMDDPCGMAHAPMDHFSGSGLGDGTNREAGDEHGEDGLE
jgi:hypothetical protein